MKIGFQESLRLVQQRAREAQSQANRIRRMGKRTSIMIRSGASLGLHDQNDATKRVPPLEQFKRFTQEILPKMEESIEIEILQKQFASLENDALRQELISSYLKRRIKLFSLDEQSLADMEVKEEQPLGRDYDDLSQIIENPSKNVNVEVGVHVNHLDESDIGSYVVYPLSDIEKYFYKQQVFGPYLEEVKQTKRFALMLTEECLVLSDLLKKIEQTKGASLPKILDAGYEDAYFQAFRVLQRELLDVYSSTKKYRQDRLFERLFATPAAFDYIVRALLRAAIQKPSQYQALLEAEKASQLKDFATEILEQVLHKSDREECNPSELDYLAKCWKKFEALQGKFVAELLDENGAIVASDLQLPEEFKGYLNAKFCGINSGVMVTGRQGSGKSGILNFLAIWALKRPKPWIVVSVPSVERFTRVETIYSRHNVTGLFVQNEFAKEWLQQFKHQNENTISEFLIDANFYGKINYSGQHDDDPDAVIDVYYKRRKVYWSEHKKFLFPEELPFIEEADKSMEARVSQRLTSPKTLLELVDYGIDNEWFACNVVCEVLEQLYRSDQHCVLVLVDQFNLFYIQSIYPSFRYETDKRLDGHVPPYHLTLCRAFLNFDGHKLKNGFKVVAPSLRRYQRHVFNSSKIQLPPGYEHQLGPLPLDDFRMMCHYYIKTLYFNSEPDILRMHEFLYMQSQGYWGEAQFIIQSRNLEAVMEQ